MARELHAEAVRLDRHGGICRVPQHDTPPDLSPNSQVLVVIDLPASGQYSPRRLCFRSTVSHVSRTQPAACWIGLSFREAAICEHCEA